MRVSPRVVPVHNLSLGLHLVGCSVGVPRHHLWIGPHHDLSDMVKTRPLARFAPAIEPEPPVQSFVISPPSTIYAGLAPTWIPETLSLNCSENWNKNPQTVAGSEMEDLQAKMTRREERLGLEGTAICEGAHASVQGLEMR